MTEEKIQKPYFATPPRPTRYFAELAAEVHRNSVEHGWWEGIEPTDPTVIGMKIALMHSELSEALEEVRDGKEAIYFDCDNPDKPEGAAVELADVIIRILDLAGALGYDIDEAVALKMTYNKTQPYKHGGKAI